LRRCRRGRAASAIYLPPRFRAERVTVAASAMVWDTDRARPTQDSVGCALCRSVATTWAKPVQKTRLAVGLAIERAVPQPPGKLGSRRTRDANANVVVMSSALRRQQ
jgi:hypothetical protein